MLAQHARQPFEAAIAAVYLHGMAGDVACYPSPHGIGKGEECLVATDLVDAMPAAFRRTRARAAEKWVRTGGQSNPFPWFTKQQ